MGILKYKVGRSNIEGEGVLATSFIYQGEDVGLGFTGTSADDLEITEDLGIWVNHSQSPSMRIIERSNNEYYLVAVRDIQQGEELTVNYWDTPNFIKKPNPAWD